MNRVAIPPVDYHIHTVYCGHAHAAMRVEAAIEQAEGLGLEEIVFLEHCDGPGDLKTIDRIRRDVAEARPGIRVLVGAECSLAPKEPFRLGARPDGADVVAFSIHHYPTTTVAHYDKPRFDPEEKEKILAVWNRAVCEVLGAYDIDVFCHPFFAMPVGGIIEDFDDAFAASAREVFDVMRERGVAFELNDSMTRKLSRKVLAGYGALVAEAKKAGLKFALGSDAHALEQIGSCSWVAEVVREVGLSGDDFIRF